MRTKHVEVVEHDEGWHDQFRRLQQRLTQGLEEAGMGGALVGIEHVGSTAVCGLWAKPILDIDLVYRERSDLTGIARALAKLGYTDEGNLGIPGREAFAYDELPGLMTHHLYACPQDSAELKRHITFRDYLRSHPQAVKEYSQAKREAAQRFPDDIDNYIAYKSPVIEKLYRSCGLLGEGE